MNLTQPLVSIGIPTFNRANSIVRTLESVLSQDYSNIEIVVSDNASIDNTMEICDEYEQKDDRIRYFRNTVNLGPTDNFLNVLHKSKGKYFMWLSDDDYIDYNYVSTCIKFIDQNEEYSIVGGRAKYYSEGKYIKDGKIANLLEESPSDRVLTHFKNIEDNVKIFGLMNRNQLMKVQFQRNMGGDWILVGNMAFLGKVLTLENTCIHRDVNKYSGQQYFQMLARSLKVSRIQAKYPHLFILFRNNWEIVCGSLVYRKINIFLRLSLALKISKVIIEQYLLKMPLSFNYLVGKFYHEKVKNLF